MVEECEYRYVKVMLWNYTELQTKTNRKPTHGV